MKKQERFQFRMFAKYGEGEHDLIQIEVQGVYYPEACVEGEIETGTCYDIDGVYSAVGHKAHTSLKTVFDVAHYNGDKFARDIHNATINHVATATGRKKGNEILGEATDLNPNKVA